MKILNKILLSALLAGGLSSCVTDSQKDCPDNPEEETGYYVMTLNVITPEIPGSRSETQADGTSDTPDVAASALENSLQKADVYFCDENDICVLKMESDYYIDPMNGQNTTIRFYLGKDITKYKFEDFVGKTMRIYIVGNTQDSEGNAIFSPIFTTTTSQDMAATKFSISGVTDRPIGDYGNAGKVMPLVSYDYFELPIDTEDGKTPLEVIQSKFNEQEGNYLKWSVNDSDNAIKLERAVARVEFRGKIDEGEESFDYAIDGLSNVKLRLYSLSPFNVNTECYLFRHTSPGTNSGWAEGDVEIFGYENSNGIDDFTGYKWVASPWWSTGSPTLLNAFTTTDYAYKIGGKAFLQADGMITLATLGKRATSEALTESNGDYKGGYHPWCYISENTLNAVSQYDTAASLATGIGFTFCVLDGKNQPITPASDPEECEFPAEIAFSTETDKTDYLEVTDLTTGDWIQLAPTEVTVGGETKKYYFIDYTAEIKHNSKSETSPMYYGVVRNNTYQVSINKIMGLPNPREPKNLYLELTVNVLSWNKRDVTMEF